MHLRDDIKDDSDLQRDDVSIASSQGSEDQQEDDLEKEADEQLDIGGMDLEPVPILEDRVGNDT